MKKITIAFSISELDESAKGFVMWAINDHLEMFSEFIDEANNKKESLKMNFKNDLFCLKFNEPEGATITKNNFSLLFGMNLYDLLPGRHDIVGPILSSLVLKK